MAAEVATNMTIGLLRAIYEQIDPIRLAEVDRSLRIAQDYGLRLGNQNLRDGALDKLIAEYPSHGFVIDKKEARKLFKKVENSNLEIDKIMSVFRVIGKMSLDKGTSFVHFINTELPEPTTAVVAESPVPEPEKGGAADE